MNRIGRIIRTTYLALATPGNVQLPIWVGPPGGGKTESETLLANALRVAPENNSVWIAAQRSPEDFNGWATPRPEGLEFEPPGDIARLVKAPRALWFLDEIGNAPRSTQSGMLRAIRERTVGNTKLPDSVMMLAAMNPPESGADAQEISFPLANRAVWLDFPEVSDDDHIEYLGRVGTNGAAMEKLPEIDPVAWRAAYREVVAIHSGFLRAWKPEDGDPNPRALIEDPESDNVRQRWPLAYCSPRAWTAAIMMAATCRLVGDMDAMTDLIIGTVGRPRGLTWLGNYESNDLMDPEAVLRDITQFKHDPMRPDRTFVQVRSVAMAACATDPPEKDRLVRWHSAWGLVKRLMAEGVGKDILLVSGQYLGTHKPKGPVLKDVQPIILELAPMVMAAGVGDAN